MCRKDTYPSCRCNADVKEDEEERGHGSDCRREKKDTKLNFLRGGIAVGTKANLAEFIECLDEQYKNGSIYVWGAQGESDISESWIKKKETSTENANRAIKLWKKRVNAGYKNIRAFDCSGLGMYYLQNITGAYSSDANANTLMNDKCSKITKRSALKMGDWVFRVNSSGRAYHIGYVVSDDLQVIEAKGRDDGVVKRGIDASGSSYWNAYGRPKIFKTEIAEKTTAKTDNGGGIVIEVDELKKGSEGAQVKTVQRLLIAMGYSCGSCGADGEFGSGTLDAVKSFQKAKGLSVDGIVGSKTWSALIK